MIGIFSVMFLGGLSGCDRNAEDLVPQPSSDFPGVIEIGELEVVYGDTLNFFLDQQRGTLSHIQPALDNESELLLGDADAAEAEGGIASGYEFTGCPELEAEINGLTAQERRDWYDAHGTLDCDEFIASPDGDYNNDAQPYYYGQLGRSPELTQGGATFTFKGTGEDVCIIVDPETVFWNQSIINEGYQAQYLYQDLFSDDGDLDIFAGMSSYYTGSPGVEIGDFKGFYTDSKGELVEIQYGECFQTGASQGMTDAHAGRGTTEFCTVATDQQEGVEFTVVLETFSVPLDDGVLSFGVAVMNERCPRVDTSECFVRQESLVPSTVSNQPRSCTDKLEAAQCGGQLASFCCANPQMCGEDGLGDRENVECEDLLVVDEEPVERSEWCDSTGLCCEDDSVIEVESESGGGGGPGL